MTPLRNDIASYMQKQLADLTPSWASDYPQTLDELQTGLQLEGVLYLLHTFKAVAKSVNTPVNKVINLINFVAMWRKTVNTVSEAEGRSLWELPLEYRGELGQLPEEFILEIADDLSTGYNTVDQVPDLINDFKLTQLNNGRIDQELNYLQTVLKSLGEQIQYDKLNEELNQRFLMVQHTLKSLRIERERLVNYQGACMA